MNPQELFVAVVVGILTLYVAYQLMVSLCATSSAFCGYAMGIGGVGILAVVGVAVIKSIKG